MPAIPVVFFYLILLIAIISLFIDLMYHYTDVLLLAGIFCYATFSVTSERPRLSAETVYDFQGCCEERLSQNSYIVSAHARKFYLSGYYTFQSYRPGDSLRFQTRFTALQTTTNPGQFHYDRYLKQKQVSHRIIPVSAIRKTGHSHRLFFLFSDFRDQLIEKVHRLIRDSTHQAMISALCLGYRNELDPSTRLLFSSTGTVHLLSVSGLHTGAVWLLIVFFLRLVRFKSKRSQLIALPVLWAYAMLTGLSPSVVRAATLLSLISLTQVLNRTYLPVNAIAVSALLSLLIQPALLYSVGFLLSYSAYTGILVLYPCLYYPKRLPFLLDKVYAACSISCSAQLLTLGLCAYYFHTVNLNGFLVNLIAIPLATCLLYSALLCLCLPEPVSQCLAFIPEKTAQLLLEVLHFFDPFSYNLKDLYPSTLSIALIYASLISFGLFFLYRKRFWLLLTISLLQSLLIFRIIQNHRHSTLQEIVIFHLRNQSATLLNYQGNYLFLHTSAADSSVWLPYIYSRHLYPLPDQEKWMCPELEWHFPCLITPTDTILFTHNYRKQSVDPGILIVIDNIRPEQYYPILPARLPRLIICDGSNTFTTRRSWQEFSRRYQIPYRATADEGAIRLSLK